MSGDNYLLCAKSPKSILNTWSCVKVKGETAMMSELSKLMELWLEESRQHEVEWKKEDKQREQERQREEARWQEERQRYEVDWRRKEEEWRCTEEEKA